jgi:hypothetical protein
MNDSWVLTLTCITCHELVVLCIVVARTLTRDGYDLAYDNAVDYLARRAEKRNQAAKVALYPAYYATDKVWPPTPYAINVLRLCHGKKHYVPLAEQVDYGTRITNYTVDADKDTNPDHLCDLLEPDALADVPHNSIDLVVFHFCHCHTSPILKLSRMLDRLSCLLKKYGVLVVRNGATRMRLNDSLDAYFEKTTFSQERRNPAFLLAPGKLCLADPLHRKRPSDSQQQAANMSTGCKPMDLSSLNRWIRHARKQPKRNTAIETPVRAPIAHTNHFEQYFFVCVLFMPRRL